MITVTDNNDLNAAFEKFNPSKDGAFATCRVIDSEACDCQEWAEHGEIDGTPCKVYYIFENEDCTSEDAGDYPWGESVSKIEIAEKDEDGDFENL